MKEILEMMANSKDGDRLPTIPSLSQMKSEGVRAKDFDHTTIHSNIRVSAIQNDLDELAYKLRVNAGDGNYKAVLDATKHPNFSEFCDIPDEFGFTAIKWAGDSGYHRIVRLLLASGVKPDKSGLKDFINIDIDEDEIERIKYLDSIKEDDEGPAEFKDTPSHQQLPTTKREKIEMIQRMNKLESELSRTNRVSITDMLIKPNSNVDDSEEKEEEEKNDDSEGKEEEEKKENEPIKKVMHVFPPDKEVMRKKQEIDKKIEINNQEAKRIKDQLDVLSHDLDVLSGVKPQTSQTSQKKKNSFASSFAKAFSRLNYSEGRSSSNPIKKGEDVKPERLEKHFSIREYFSQNSHNLDNLSQIDVSKFMLKDEIILPETRMLRQSSFPGDISHSDVRKIVKENVPKSMVDGLTDIFTNYINNYFYMYHHLLDSDRVEVRDSPIHGKGVFAKRRIQKFKIITFMMPNIIAYSKDNSNFSFKLTNYEDINPKDMFMVNNFNDHNITLLTSTKNYDDSRFLCHMINDPKRSETTTPSEYERDISDRANATMVFNKNKIFVYICSIHDIEVGDEILMPYGTDYWFDQSKGK